MALQRLGAADMGRLLREARTWARGNRFEQRAAAAALAEPALLRREAHAVRALKVLDAITASVAGATDRRDEGFRVLRQALGYCWRVVVAATPHAGRDAMERWLRSGDPDVAWIMRENLKKKRMQAAGEAWVARWKERPG